MAKPSMTRPMPNTIAMIAAACILLPLGCEGIQRAVLRPVDPDGSSTTLDSGPDAAQTDSRSADGAGTDLGGDAAPRPAVPWGRWVASLGLDECPSGTVLVVDTAVDELDGGPSIDTLEQAGEHLSFTEALHIAHNRGGAHTIFFDENSFPVDNPTTILMTRRRNLSLGLHDVCIDGRNRGVVVQWQEEAECGLCMWRLDQGSYLIGLTLVRMPSEMLVDGGRIAGCRLNTDGYEELHGVDPTLLYAWPPAGGEARGIVGPANVLGVGFGVKVNGEALIEGNYFGYDPVTKNSFSMHAAIFFGDAPVGTPGPVEVVGNVFSPSLGVTMHDTTDQGVVVFAGNRFGVDLDGTPLSADPSGAPSGFYWSGGGDQMAVTLGPNNVIHGASLAVFHGGRGRLRITRNSIYANDAYIRTTTLTPPLPTPPTIDSGNRSGASGGCATSGTIELYSDRGDQGELFLAELPCDAVAGWSHVGPIPTERNLTATLTIDEHTSAFSDPFPID